MTVPGGCAGAVGWVLVVRRAGGGRGRELARGGGGG